jgi:hypothetical protein
MKNELKFSHKWQLNMDRFVTRTEESFQEIILNYTIKSRFFIRAKDDSQ